MSGYQGSDWFKSGVHLRSAGRDDTQQLIRQADQQISDCSRQLQAAYDGALTVFSNFTGTDVQVDCSAIGSTGRGIGRGMMRPGGSPVLWLQVARAQESLAAIKAVRQSLQDLHKRLAPSLSHTNSETALSYVAPTEQQDTDPLAALKAKEEQLQLEVNRCRRLTAENALLNKQLQVGVRAATW